jgi:hypothetical protein
MLSGGEHGTTFRHYIKKIRTITMLQETHAHTLLYISAQCTARLSLTDCYKRLTHTHYFIYQHSALLGFLSLILH